jgi:hypothetical protein
VGTFVGSGRSLIIDAKEGSETHRLVLNDTHLADHQRQALIDHGRAGAVAGVLALNTQTQRLYWCDWRLLLTEQSTRSLRWLDLVDIGPASMTVDWARVLRAAAEEAAMPV